MAIYGSRGARATKKARRKKKIGISIPASKRTEKVLRKKRKVREKSAPVKKRSKALAKAKKSKASLTRRVKRGSKTSSKVSPKKVAKARPKKSASKKPAVRATAKKRGVKSKSASKSVAKKATAKSAVKKKTVKTRGTKSTRGSKKAPIRGAFRKKSLTARQKRLGKKLDKKLDKKIKGLVKLQQATRGKGKKSPAKKAVLKRRISNERIEGVAAIANVPQRGAEFQRFADDTFNRMQKRFPKLLGIATITGQTPKRPRLPSRLPATNKRFAGEQRRVSIGKILVSRIIPDILYKVDHAVKKMSQKFPIWSAKLAFSGFGERLIGSANQILRADDPDARYFQAAGYDSTGIFQSFQGMRDSLEGMLEDYANTIRTLVYLHFIEIRNVERKA